jgi:chemotaxis protein MotA
MDLTTIFGIGLMAGLLWLGAATGQIPAFFLNWHGLIIVCGGSAGALLLSTPMDEILEAVGALTSLFRGRSVGTNSRVVAQVFELAERFRARGSAAWRDVDSTAAGGFLARAAGLAAELNDADMVRTILESEINSAYDRRNEVVNVYRTLAILAPMFGLLGTLIGIVSVLRDLSNPDAIGAAMGVAMTTAFYGIGMANAVCVPIAGKLRLRNMQELKARGLVCEGVVMMMKGSVPLVIQRRLLAEC